MNIFFGIRSNSLNYKLTIPKFQSSKSIPNEQYNLYKITVVNEKWQIDEAKCEGDRYF